MKNLQQAADDVGVIAETVETLGTEFDEWLGLPAIKRYGFGPLPADAEAAFQAKFAEKRAEIKASQLGETALMGNHPALANTDPCGLRTLYPDKLRT